MFKFISKIFDIRNYVNNKSDDLPIKVKDDGVVLLGSSTSTSTSTIPLTNIEIYYVSPTSNKIQIKNNRDTIDQIDFVWNINTYYSKNDDSKIFIQSGLINDDNSVKEIPRVELIYNDNGLPCMRKLPPLVVKNNVTILNNYIRYDRLTICDPETMSVCRIVKAHHYIHVLNITRKLIGYCTMGYVFEIYDKLGKHLGTTRTYYPTEYQVLYFDDYEFCIIDSHGSYTMDMYTILNGKLVCCESIKFGHKSIFFQFGNNIVHRESRKFSILKFTNQKLVKIPLSTPQADYLQCTKTVNPLCFIIPSKMQFTSYMSTFERVLELFKIPDQLVIIIFEYTSCLDILY